MAKALEGGTAPTWSVFDGFERPRQRMSWSMLDELVERGHRFMAERGGEFLRLLQAWKELLSELDGIDPSDVDWSEFRPLRTDREEDWSDWLQHFLGTSETGYLAHQIFSRSGFSDAKRCARPGVGREVVTEGRRADLVIRWSNGHISQLEVKVGDKELAKTIETAIKLERDYPAEQWTHYILLPPNDRELWNALDTDASVLVHVVTWEDVAIALRRCLRNPGESRRWRMWAHGFCGLIEQKLLRYPLAKDVVRSSSAMQRRVHQISTMQRSLQDV